MPETPELPAPGIYFGMDEATYHAAPAFSASGIKDINVSPLRFYLRSWMNPNREPDEEDTPAKILGTACHVAVLEGMEAFQAAYALKPDPSDYPDALATGKDLKAACKALGLKQNGTLEEMSARIREVDAVVPLWVEIVEAFERENAGKIVLTPKQWADVHMAALVISRMPSVRSVFSGGRSEVSIFWEASGIPMKARLDYLKPGAIGDLKTFANINEREIKEAVAGEVARNRYFIQPIVYTAAVVAAKKMFATSGMDAVHGDVDAAWLREVMASKHHKFSFVFMQTGGVPDTIKRDWVKHERYGGQGQTTNAYWTKGELAVREGLSRFKRCMETFGPDTPWIIDHQGRAFRDEEFPLYMLDSPAELETAA